jgi:voltage-gated potassium channel
MEFQLPKKYRKIFILMTIFIALIAVGTIGFMLIENLGAGDAVTLTIAVMTTSGSGLSIPIQTTAGQFFSDFLMIFGVGIGFYALAQIFETMFTGKLREMFKMVDYEPIIAKMRDHVIVCGYGTVGRSAISDMRIAGIQVVVLEKTEVAMAELDKDIPRVIGDSTKEDDLARAGIGKSKCVLVTFCNDADAILTTVTVKYLAPSMQCIVRAAREDNIDKMYKVGADAVIFPELEGGKSMATQACVQFGKGPKASCGAVPAQPPLK